MDYDKLMAAKGFIAECLAAEDRAWPDYLEASGNADAQARISVAAAVEVAAALSSLKAIWPEIKADARGEDNERAVYWAYDTAISLKTVIEFWLPPSGAATWLQHAARDIEDEAANIIVEYEQDAAA